MHYRVIVVLVSAFILASCGVFSNNDEENQAILNRLDLSVVQVEEKTQMMIAAEKGDSQSLKQAFTAGESVNSVSSEGTAFSLALTNGHTLIAKILLAAGCDWKLGFDQIESSALIEASARGFNEIVKTLLIREAEVGIQDQSGYTALARAAINGHLTTLKILVNAGADVDVISEDRSLLMHVVDRNNMLIAQQLIAAGADVNYRDAQDDTALKIARRKGYFDLDLMLVQSGATP